MQFHKLFPKLTIALMLGLFSTTFTSCNDDDDDPWMIIQVGAYNIDYNAEGYWSKCYQTNPVAELNLGPVNFSHTATTNDWGESWYGFCPSRSTDNENYPASERWMHQWGSITGGDWQDLGAGYMLAFWDVSENTFSVPANPSLKISLKGGESFRPSALSITNTAYAYYTMLEGSDFSEPFDETSWTTVTFIGVKNGAKTGQVTAYLAKGTNIIDKWVNVGLGELGTVDYIYCQMASSDHGQHGMNTPAYFCMDNFMFEVAK